MFKFNQHKRQMKYLLILIITLHAFNAYAKTRIAGDWLCKNKTEPAVALSGFATIATLIINKQEALFTRNGEITLRVNEALTPIVHIKTFEKGSVALSGNTLTLTPIKASMEVIKGSLLVKDNDPEMINMLSEPETGEIKFISENIFTVTITSDEGVQINTCSKKL